MRSLAASLLIAIAAAAGVVSAACARVQPPPATSPIVETGMVGGTVQMSIVPGAQLPPVLVSVAGATVTSNLSQLGDFVMTNVPSGPLELRFTGDGIAASLPLGEMHGGETITVAVLLTPSQASVDAISRIRGKDAFIEGRVGESPTLLPDGTIIVGGRTVIVPAGMSVPKPGTRVRVTGTLSAAGVAARELSVI